MNPEQCRAELEAKRAAEGNVTIKDHQTILFHD